MFLIVKCYSLVHCHIGIYMSREVIKSFMNVNPPPKKNHNTKTYPSCAHAADSECTEWSLYAVAGVGQGFREELCLIKVGCRGTGPLWREFS